MLILEFLASFVSALLFIVQTAMFLRAILSWFIPDENNRLVQFLIVITEPFIIPVRVLLEKLNLFQNTPIDVSFFITYLLLWVITLFL